MYGLMGVILTEVTNYRSVAFKTQHLDTKFVALAQSTGASNIFPGQLFSGFGPAAQVLGSYSISVLSFDSMKSNVKSWVPSTNASSHTHFPVFQKRYVAKIPMKKMYNYLK